MTAIEIKLPAGHDDLQQALEAFITAEFQQAPTVQSQESPEDTAKSWGKMGRVIWTIFVVTATVEGTLQFAERMQRFERVKALQEVIKTKGTDVYLRIGDKAINLAEQSVDDVMNYLAEQLDKGWEDNKGADKGD